MLTLPSFLSTLGPVMITFPNLSVGEDVGSARGGGVGGEEATTGGGWRGITGGGSGGGGGPPERGPVQDELHDTEQHHDEAAQEPDLHSGDRVGGRHLVPGGVDDVEHDDGDDQLEAESDQGLGQEEGQPGERGEDGGGEVEGEQGGGDGPGQQDLHPVHAVVPWPDS